MKHPVTLARIECSQSFSAARWSRARPYGPKSARMKGRIVGQSEVRSCPPDRHMSLRADRL